MPTFRPNSQIVGRVGTNSFLSVASYCQGEWVVAVPPGALNAADNSGNAILTPSTQVAAAKLGLRVHGATELLVSCFYETEVTDGKITDPVVQAFGVDVNGVYNRLFLSSDGTTHELTLTAAEATDLITPCPSLRNLLLAADPTYAGTLYKMTTPKIIRLDGALNVVLGVKTAVAIASPFAADAALAAVLVKPR